MGLKGKKKERKEKSKVKLKAKKTLLPKGQNVTDTSFKVKKIVIREQLKASDDSEPLTRRKLNVKELLSRLQHHNTTVRQDGLDGLKELTTGYPPEVFVPHLAALIEGITALILDRENSIRRDALKLLRSILTQVTAEQILPFFDVLQSYLGCAMTHIHTVTQEDSLLLLDVLLETTPTLIADNSHRIFPNFLDMISKLRTESQPGRTLTVNLGSKMTSVKWRIKVLTRLHGLMTALVSNRAAKRGANKEAPGSMQEYRWNQEKALNAPIHYGNFISTCELPILFGGAAGRGAETSATELQSYVQVLMPLLFETWIEIAPSKREAQEDAAESALSEESAELLKCILEIIQLSWEYLQSWEEETQLFQLTNWFKGEYEKDILKYLMYQFPFTKVEAVPSRKAAKRKRRQESVGSATATASTGACVEQNLAICYILCCVHERAEVALCRRVLKYVTKCVNGWQHLDAATTTQLLRVVRSVLTVRSRQWASRGIPVDRLVDAVLAGRRKVNAHFQEAVFEMLSDLVLDPTLTHLLQCPGFETWRSELPNVLCDAEVPLKTVKVLTRLACQDSRPLLDSLTEKLPAILENLSSLKVIGAESEMEGRFSVANLLYWVSKNPDFTTTLEYYSTKWNERLTIYVQQIVSPQ